MTIRLLLVDDHAVVRSGLRMLLASEGDVEIVGEAGSGSEAVSAAGSARPDVILMDIGLPDMSGIEAARAVKSKHPEIAVVALTIHEDEEYFFKMLEAGASGYLPKRAAADDLVAAIRAVAAGQVCLQPALARWLLEDYQRLAKLEESPARSAKSGAAAVGLEILSQRERQVLELVGQGCNNQQIGERLGLSPKTIARHRERIMNKLNLHSRTELVKFAIRTGLITA